MKKPWYFMPFIAVYKMIFFILLLPFKTIKYASLGLFFVIKRGIFPLTKSILVGAIKGLKLLYHGIGFIIKLLSMLLYNIYIYTKKGLQTVIKLLGIMLIYFAKGLRALAYLARKIFLYFVMGIYTLLFLLWKWVCTLARYNGVTILSIGAIFKSLGKRIGLQMDWSKFIRARDAEYALIVKERKELERERKHREQEILSKQIAAIQRARREAELAEQRAQNPSDTSLLTVEEGASEEVLTVTEPKTFIEKIKDFFYKLNHLPETIRNSKARKAMNMPKLVLDFEGDDAIKSEKKQLYEYIAKTPEGKVVKDYFEAFSKVEVHSYLLSEGYEVYSIRTSKLITFLHGQSSTNKTKVKTKDLIFFITQLSTYNKPGIPLADALKILSRQYKKPAYKKIFGAVVYDLTMGVSFSETLEKQGNAFPKLLINMIKTAEMTGELPEALDDMAAYYTEAEKTRKQMVTALMYPTMVLVFATGVVIFILIWVIPQFVEIYKSMDASKIPGFTLFVMAVSDFLKAYIIFILLGIAAFVGIFIYLYKHIQPFRQKCQWFAMHIPVMGNVIIYNEVTMFTKTFSSLLKHNVFITDSMEILTKITNNEIYNILIKDIIDNIGHGEKISKSFENHWAFPIPAYEMLVTGEKTGQLPDMMGKVSSYYQEQHAQQVARIKTFVEPILIIFLTVVVGGIILAIIIPMFGMYDMIE